MDFPNSHLQLIKKNGYQDLVEKIDGTMEIIKLVGQPVKLGSTQGLVLKDPETGALKIFLREAYRFGSLSNVLCFYLYEKDTMNKHEYSAIKAGMYICGSTNMKGDSAKINVESRMCVVYATLKAKPSGEAEKDLSQLLHYKGSKKVESMLVNGHVFTQSGFTLSYCSRTAKIMRTRSHNCTNGTCSTDPSYDLRDLSTLSQAERQNIQTTLLIGFPDIHHDIEAIFSYHRRAIQSAIQYNCQTFRVKEMELLVDCDLDTWRLSNLFWIKTNGKYILDKENRLNELKYCGRVFWSKDVWKILKMCWELKRLNLINSAYVNPDGIRVQYNTPVQNVEMEIKSASINVTSYNDIDRIS